MATGLHAAALPLNHEPRGLSCKSDGPVASLLLLLSGRMLGGWTPKDQLMDSGRLSHRSAKRWGCLCVWARTIYNLFRHLQKTAKVPLCARFALTVFPINNRRLCQRALVQLLFLVFAPVFGKCLVSVLEIRCLLWQNHWTHPPSPSSKHKEIYIVRLLLCSSGWKWRWKNAFTMECLSTRAWNKASLCVFPRIKNYLRLNANMLCTEWI